MDIIMKTFYGDDGNYADISLPKILDRMSDDWIDDKVTGENISELRNACRTLYSLVNSTGEEPPTLSIDKIKSLFSRIEEQENDRLRRYGSECSMGKCAQSRIHLIQGMRAELFEE